MVFTCTGRWCSRKNHRNLSEMQEGSGKAEKQTCNYRYGVYRSKGFGNPWSDWGNSRIIFSDYVTGSGRCAD